MRVIIRGTFGQRQTLGRRVVLRGLAEPCPPLARFPEVESVAVEGCRLTGFPPEAFRGPGEAFKITFFDCRVDWDALFEQMLTHGAGRWRVGGLEGVPLKKRRALQAVSAMGDVFLDRPEVRRQAVRLQCKTALPAPTREDLWMAGWPRKLVRVRALEWLTALASPLPASGRLLVLGRPQNRGVRELKRHLTEGGYTLVRSLDSADAVVILSRPKKLDEVIASDVPLIFEPQLREVVEANRERGLEINPQQEAGLRQMLSNVDPDVVRQGLCVLEQLEVDQRVLPELLVAMLFHAEADIRKAARKQVLARGPQAIIDRFEGDKSRWTGVSNRRRVDRLVKEMERMGVDSKRFALGMAVHQLERCSGDFNKFCVALAPLYGADFFDAVAHVHRSFLAWYGQLPDGIDRLQVDRLRLYGAFDLSNLAGSPAQSVEVFGPGASKNGPSSSAAWDLAPLARCPNLTLVLVGGRFVNHEALLARGVQVRRA